MFALRNKIEIIVAYVRYAYLIKILSCILIHMIHDPEIPVVLLIGEFIFCVIGLCFACCYKREQRNPNHYINVFFVMNAFFSGIILFILFQEDMNPFDETLRYLHIALTIAISIPFCIGNADIQYPNQIIQPIDSNIQLI